MPLSFVKNMKKIQRRDTDRISHTSPLSMYHIVWDDEEKIELYRVSMTETSERSVDESKNDVQTQKLDQENLGGFFRGVAASFRSSIPALKSSVR